MSILLILALPSLTFAQHNHGGTGDGTEGGGMTPWLHFQLGDSLYIEDWVPATPGALFGACFALFMLAAIERLVAAMRAIMERWWKARVDELLAKRALQERKENDNPLPQPRKRINPPFILSHDLPRGIIYAGHAALGYALMLAVMTFHAGYIISIIVGLGVGEVLFGRYGH